MRYLALDIGTRRTGVAFLDDAVGIPLPLDTFVHASHDELLPVVRALIAERKIDRVIIGLPRLPSGDEGSQAAVSRAFGQLLDKEGVRIEFADERFTTPQFRPHKHAISPANIDGDAAAACALLSVKIGH